MTDAILSPLPPTLSVREGRDAYLAENGFKVEEYDAARVPIALVGVTFMLPNTRGRQHAVRWHDLHHVATGYGTDPAGEGEISAWEMRGGLGGLDLYVRAIVAGGVGLGLAFAPGRTRAAWNAASHRTTNLFSRDLSEYDAILRMTIGELRALLGVPEQGLAILPRRLHAAAPR